jgi:hypothetical protein
MPDAAALRVCGAWRADGEPNLKRSAPKARSACPARPYQSVDQAFLRQPVRLVRSRTGVPQAFDTWFCTDCGGAVQLRRRHPAWAPSGGRSGRRESLRMDRYSARTPGQGPPSLIADGAGRPSMRPALASPSGIYATRLERARSERSGTPFDSRVAHCIGRYAARSCRRRTREWSGGCARSPGGRDSEQGSTVQGLVAARNRAHCRCRFTNPYRSLLTAGAQHHRAAVATSVGFHSLLRRLRTRPRSVAKTAF